MQIPDMVDEVHAKFGWISILVRGETLPSMGILASGDNVHARCHKMADGRPVLSAKRDDFEFEEVVFPRSELIVTNEAGDDITDEFLKFTQTIGA